MAYAHRHAGPDHRVYVYSLEQNKSFPVTDGLTEATEPVFDASGKYLYFLGSTDTGMSKHGFSQSAADSRQPRWSLDLVVLKKDLPSPFLRESDEEKGENARAEADAEGRRRPNEGPDAPFAIDFEGIDQRILVVPAARRELREPEAGAAGQVFYLSPAGERGGRGGGRRLRRRRPSTATTSTDARADRRRPAWPRTS